MDSVSDDRHKFCGFIFATIDLNNEYTQIPLHPSNNVMFWRSFLLLKRTLKEQESDISTVLEQLDNPNLAIKLKNSNWPVQSCDWNNISAHWVKIQIFEQTDSIRKIKPTRNLIQHSQLIGSIMQRTKFSLYLVPLDPILALPKK